MGRESRIKRSEPKGNPNQIELGQRQYDPKIRNSAVRMHDGIFIIDSKGTYRRATKEQIEYLEQLNKKQQNEIPK